MQTYVRLNPVAEATLISHSYRTTAWLEGWTDACAQAVTFQLQLYSCSPDVTTIEGAANFCCNLSRKGLHLCGKPQTGGCNHGKVASAA